MDTDTYSTAHPHDAAPIYDPSGRCLVCVEIVLLEEREQLRTEREEVEFQLRGGTDADGPVQGLDGLSLPDMANVLHSLAVRGQVLEAAIRQHHHSVITAADEADRIAAERRLWASNQDA